MFINRSAGCLIALLLLTSRICGFARIPFLKESQCVVPCDSLQRDDLGQTCYSQDSNTIIYHTSQFDAKQLILPGSLIVVGTVGVYSSAFGKLNNNIKNGMDDLRGSRYIHIDDYLQYLPALTYLTFGSIGIKSKHSFRERVTVEATAYISMATLTNIGKYTFREKRPDSRARHSFPSGHTATVFTGAELMREEYGTAIGIGAYSIAVGVALLRLYNGRHWLNDVVAGAGLGILSARIGYWMLPVYQRWFKWDKSLSHTVMASPSFNPTERSFSFNLTYIF